MRPRYVPRLDVMISERERPQAEAILRYLDTCRPGTAGPAARTVAARVDMQTREARRLLEHLEGEGYVQRLRVGSGPWRWEITARGRGVITNADDLAAVHDRLNAARAKGVKDGEALLADPAYQEGEPVALSADRDAPQTIIDAYRAGAESVLGKGNVTIQGQLSAPDTGTIRLEGDNIVKPWRYR